ncbi:hypothetical protein DL93DRAFT_2172329 [Clavulina sp. PMI_390]|nr:hypothetical protein DL93DRAFT_2172329 [Clavulina sp. PMI_390]
MATRKKSTASPAPSVILAQAELGPATNNLKKQGSQNVPLYQQCLAITSRLQRLREFAPYFELARRTAIERDAPADNTTTPATAGPSGSTSSDPSTSTAPSRMNDGMSNAQRRSSDPVQTLWDVLCLGSPLVFLLNSLPIPSQYKVTNLNVDPRDFNAQDPKFAKQCTAKVIIALTKLNREVPEWMNMPELFTIGDLILTAGPRNMNGFVKVMSTVQFLIDRIPEDCFDEEAVIEEPEMEDDEELEGLDEAARRKWSSRKKAAAELVESERNFVNDLQVLQDFAMQLRQQNICSPTLIHNIFMNINELLDMQRRFSIVLEQTAEQKWPNQRWGNVFVANEGMFSAYEPFCANFATASDLAIEYAEELMAKTELQAFLIKPVQRITKYPLLLETLQKYCEPSWEHYNELSDGLAAAKRIAARMNEANLASDNYVTLKNLERRVVDWKGHAIAGFGSLRLDELFTVTKSEVDRDYHVFLFERIILCCKESTDMAGDRSSVTSKKSSILSKKNSTAAVPAYMDKSAAARKKTTPLLLKGRIFLSNVTKAVAQMDKDIGYYAVEVWWRGDEGLEFFTLKCRSEEVMKRWEGTINELVRTELEKHKAQKAQRKREKEEQRMMQLQLDRTSSTGSLVSRPSMSSLSMSAGGGSTPNVTSMGMPPMPHHSHSYMGPNTGNTPMSASRLHYSQPPSNHSDSQLPQMDRGPLSAGPAMGYPHTRGPSISSTSGGPTRSKDLSRFLGDADLNNAYASSRSPGGAMFDDDDRSPVRGTPVDEATLRGQRYPRSTSALGGRITPSGQYPMTPGGGPGPQQQRPGLRSQFSSVRLADAYSEQEQDAHEIALARARAATTPMSNGRQTPTGPMPQQYQQQQQQGMPRTRATSTPAQAAMPRGPYGQGAPPLPNQPPMRYGSTSSTVRSVSGSIAASSTVGEWSSTASMTTVEGDTSNGGTNKRGSGSSQFSGASHDSSASSGNDQHGGTISPLTPYGSSDSNVGSVLRQGTKAPTAPPGAYGYQQHQKKGSVASQHVSAAVSPITPITVAGQPPVKIKVHYKTDLFMIAVPRDVTYDDLAEKVHKKIKLCGGDRAPDAMLKIKYVDDEGDYISIGSDEDVTMALDTGLTTLALYVQ